MLTAANQMVPKQVPAHQAHEAGGRGKASSTGREGNTLPVCQEKHMNKVFSRPGASTGDHGEGTSPHPGQAVISMRDRQENKGDPLQCCLGAG